MASRSVSRTERPLDDDPETHETEHRLSGCRKLTAATRDKRGPKVTPNDTHKNSARPTSQLRIWQRESVQATGRCARYLAIRGFAVFVTVLVGVYAAVWVTNLGGYMDDLYRAGIRYRTTVSFRAPELSPEEREAALGAAIENAIERAGLNRPFFYRSFAAFRAAITLRGRSGILATRTGSDRVVDILLERMPLTLLLFGIANTITFFGGLLIALWLSRRYGTFADRASTMIIPAFAGPPWFHGFFLILIFASFARVLPFGGLIDVPIPETQLAYGLSVLKHMILPVAALVLGTMPHAIYANRALFLLNSSEDYVELGRSKGLTFRRLARRYVLRPVLPPIITNFALISVVSWQSVILTESVFNWPGMGDLLIEAITRQQTSVVIGAVTMFAYFLGATVIALDILYVIVDPRVSMGKRRGI